MLQPGCSREKEASSPDTIAEMKQRWDQKNAPSAEAHSVWAVSDPDSGAEKQKIDPRKTRLEVKWCFFITGKVVLLDFSMFSQLMWQQYSQPTERFPSSAWSAPSKTSQTIRGGSYFYAYVVWSQGVCPTPSSFSFQSLQAPTAALSRFPSCTQKWRIRDEPRICGQFTTRADPDPCYLLI